MKHALPVRSSRYLCLQCGVRPVDPMESDFCTGCEELMNADAEHGLLT